MKFMQAFDVVCTRSGTLCSHAVVLGHQCVSVTVLNALLPPLLHRIRQWKELATACPSLLLFIIQNWNWARTFWLLCVSWIPSPFGWARLVDELLSLASPKANATAVVSSSTSDQISDAVSPAGFPSVISVARERRVASVDLRLFAALEPDQRRFVGFGDCSQEFAGNERSNCMHHSRQWDRNHTNWWCESYNSDTDSSVEFARRTSGRTMQWLTPSVYRTDSYWRAHANSTFSWFPSRHRSHRRNRQSDERCVVAATMDPFHLRNLCRAHWVER